MARYRQWIALEDGLRLNLKELVGQRLKQARPVVVGSITCDPQWAGNAGQRAFSASSYRTPQAALS
jgi:hypothetical protein